MSLIPRAALAKVSNSVVRFDTLADAKPRLTPESKLVKPSDQELQQTTLDTKRALEAKLAERLGHQSLSIAVNKPSEATFVRYETKADAPGYNPATANRLIRIADVQSDPLEPARFRHQRLPPGPGPAPPPVMRSPPRKPSKAELDMWKVPPAISNWKNPKGFVIPLDQRVGADGRGMQETSVNEKFANLAEDLFLAEKKARDDIRTRSRLAQRQAAAEEEQREAELRRVAEEARRNFQVSENEVEKARREVMRETLREHRMAKAGRIREGDRDISEQVALGKSVQSSLRGEAIYDARLFNKTSGTGMGEEEGGEGYEGHLFGKRSGGDIYRFDAQRIRGEEQKWKGGTNEETRSRQPVQFEEDRPNDHKRFRKH